MTGVLCFFFFKAKNASVFLVRSRGLGVLKKRRGLSRRRYFYTRLHGPTKATTLGVGCLLVASSIFFSVTGEGLSLHEILVSLFLFITAPISAHLLAKAALHRKLPSLTPSAETFDTPESQE